MTTEAGKRLVDRWTPAPSDAADPAEEWVARAWADRTDAEGYVAAIEAEARHAALTELREAIQGLPTAKYDGQNLEWITPRPFRAAVLSLIDAALGKSVTGRET